MQDRQHHRKQAGTISHAKPLSCLKQGTEHYCNVATFLYEEEKGAFFAAKKRLGEPTVKNDTTMNRSQLLLQTSVSCLLGQLILSPASLLKAFS